MNKMEAGSLAFDYQTFLTDAPDCPGVYLMLASKNGEKNVLYVGKAKKIKQRLKSYFQKHPSQKIQRLLQKTQSIEWIITQTETEALLLEQTLIKKHRPFFNVLLRDDKSYPYIYLSDHNYPRLAFHRGSNKLKGTYFGPFPNAGAVRETLALLQKMFKVRQCEDSFFSHRSRPCLQYQMKRCKAPCVDYVKKHIYAEDVRYSMLFLQGKNQLLQKKLIQQMNEAAALQAYEKAAQYRDTLRRIRLVQEQQFVDNKAGDIDVLGIASCEDVFVITIMLVRGGRVLGQNHYVTRQKLEDRTEKVLEDFLAQYYIALKKRRNFPKSIILPHNVGKIYSTPLVEALRATTARSVRITQHVRGTKKEWQMLCQQNSERHLKSHLDKVNQRTLRTNKMQKLLKLKELNRIECFDISHTLGEATVASCVVFSKQGPSPSNYRKYNLANTLAGDDYAAMAEVMKRRFSEGSVAIPDLIVIDGGIGQIRAAHRVAQHYKQAANIAWIGIAKGPSRKPGLEHLVTLQGKKFVLAHNDPTLLLLQHIRDEAHRFAITGHRRQRQKSRQHSELEKIQGIGVKRRRVLLNYFGGWQDIVDAPIREIKKVPGISQYLAEKIYAYLHH